MKKKVLRERISPRMELEGIKDKIYESVHPKGKLTLKEELDNLHAEISYARRTDTPTRGKIFGEPGKPLGICSGRTCGKTFPLDQLQKYYLDPQTCYWLCPRCQFKKRMREKFNPRL